MSHNLLVNWLLPIGIVLAAPFAIALVGLLITLPVDIHFNGERDRYDPPK